MSHEVWKGRADSGIPKNIGGSIKRECVAAMMFAKARLANLTIPELEQSRAAVVNTIAFLLRSGYSGPGLVTSTQNSSPPHREGGAGRVNARPRRPSP
jgi:hypothetical protein